MKILCVCNDGNVRSVCLARELKDMGFEAIAIGAMRVSQETMQIMADWADKIIWMSEKKRPFNFNCLEMDLNVMKIFMSDIGIDVWNNPFHPELREICQKIRDKIK